LHRRRCLVIKLSHADNRLRAGQQISRIAANLCPAVRQVTHLTRQVLRHPILVTFEVARERLRPSDAGEFETTLPRKASDNIGLHLLIVAGAILGLKAA
jgi:uncharacterized protein (DUF2267 family)